ncbi:MAG TPA: glycosyltransferase family 4 protein [Bacteroidales bacterium]|jgi:glycosyltransferase involved in cell wall biosynthesis|nr:glycosyltransferase family 4 protein [Bacteroidales bacterium]HOS72284.1 glycosyltransferase family 4 protein [Bacteroidales bacterium]HQH24387.1 glycosyltransferase family 4 protein [Bacteroidales bacterium]HQJ81480.1 glycosyltransferase family 4 protein [Bacteroidales bacterium]
MNVLMLLENDYEKDLRVKREVRALHEAGFRVTVAAISRERDFPPEQRDNCLLYKRKIPVFIYKSSVAALKLPFYFNFWRKYVREIVRDYPADIIHVNDLPLARIGLEMKKAGNVKFVLDLHENWPGLLRNAQHTRTLAGRLASSDKQWVRYEKDMVQEADMVITVVEEAGDRVAALTDRPEKIYIVSNTIDTENISFYERQGKNREFTLFYGGAINKHRGLQIVIQAIKILKDRNVPVSLQIIGTGSYRKVLEKEIEKNDLSSRIEFHGYKPLTAMLEMLSHADAAIIPHLRNENNDASMPNKLFQYMFSATPVISSDCISLKRIILETGAGFIYRNDSPSELASLLEQLSHNRDMTGERGKKGREAVLARYNWNHDRKQLIDAYKNLSKTDT